MEMSSESMRPKIAGHLADLIRANGCRLDTGFLSTPFLLDTLMQYGYKDLAYKVFYQTECPSWLYEVNKGATTIWEKWNAIRPDGSICGTSFNHYSFGCIGDWMLRKLAGLNMAEPSYRKSIIAPDLDCGLDFVKARTETIYGEIACSWRLEGDKAVIDVTIPPNTTSKIFLPYADGEKVTRVATGSGNYHFEYNY
jgi:alpha-L-rhamnosidase